MLLLICKNCGKNISNEEMRKGNVLDISKCPCCKKSLKNAERHSFTKEEMFLEDMAIAKMIEERDKNDNGIRYTFEEVKQMIKRKERK